MFDHKWIIQAFSISFCFLHVVTVQDHIVRVLSLPKSVDNLVVVCIVVLVDGSDDLVTNGVVALTPMIFQTVPLNCIGAILLLVLQGS